MTGLLGGGYAIYWDAASRTASQPRLLLRGSLGGRRRHARAPGAVRRGARPLRDRTRVVRGAGRAGGARCVARAVRTPDWRDLFEPAIRLARVGVEMSPAQASCLAMLAPVMTMDAGARIYAPHGMLVQAGEMLRQPGLEKVMALLRAEGARSAYTGSLAQGILSLMRRREGLVTADDLSSYEAAWSEPLEIAYAGMRVLARGGLAELPDLLPRLPRLADLDETERVLALLPALETFGPETHTTNTTVVDRDGNACVFTTSLGLGLGRLRPGARPAPEQHARRDRPRRRRARAGRADELDDDAVARARLRTSSCWASARPEARVCGPRSSCRSPGSSTRASSRRRRSTGRAST